MQRTQKRQGVTPVTAHILFLVNIDGVNINALTLEEAS